MTVTDQRIAELANADGLTAHYFAEAATRSAYVLTGDIGTDIVNNFDVDDMTSYQDRLDLARTLMTVAAKAQAGTATEDEIRKAADHLRTQGEFDDYDEPAV